MEKRNLLFLLPLLFFSSINSTENENNSNETPDSAEIQVTKNTISYGSIVRIKNDHTEAYLTSPEAGKAGCENNTKIDNYWFVQPVNPEEKTIKYKVAVRNDSKIRLVNVKTGEVLGKHPWIIEVRESIEPLWAKEDEFTLKDPETGKYLSTSTQTQEESDLYVINLRETLVPGCLWKLANFYPATMQKDLESGSTVGIKFLVNDKYLTWIGNININVSVADRRDDSDIINELVTPISTEANSNKSKFTIEQKGAFIAFKLKENSYYLQATSNEDTYWYHGEAFRHGWGVQEHHPMRGILQVRNESKSGKGVRDSDDFVGREKFRLERFHIKNNFTGGYLTYIGTLGTLLENQKDQHSHRKIKGFSVSSAKEFPGSDIQDVLGVPIISAYNKALFEEGEPNAKNYLGLFAIEVISGADVLPLPPTEEFAPFIEETVELKLDTAQRGKFRWEGETEIPGYAQIVFKAKALDCIFIGFASEEKDFQTNDDIFEIIIGAGIDEKSNSHTLIRNKHNVKLTNEIGTHIKDKTIPDKDWNFYWAKVTGGNKLSVGHGEDIGENVILTWESPEKIPVKYVGLSNYVNPIDFADITVSTPEITEEIKAELFVDKLKKIRDTKLYTNKIAQYIAMIPEAIIDDTARDIFIDEIIWLAPNTLQEKFTEFHKLINAAKWNPNLTNNDPLRIAILDYFALKTGLPITFDKKMDTLEQLLNLAYTQEKAKQFLVNNKNAVVILIKTLSEEGMDESPEMLNRVKAVLQTAICDSVFAENASNLQRILDDLSKPVTIETLQERLDSGSAEQDRAAQERFIKSLKKVFDNTNAKLKTEMEKGPLSGESLKILNRLTYLLKSIIYNLTFMRASKNEAEKLLTQLPVEKEEISEEIIEELEEGANVADQFKFILSMTRGSTFRSPARKQSYITILSKLASNKNLTIDMIEKLRTIISFVKENPILNTQDLAVLNFYEEQLSVPVTIDDKIKLLLKSVLTVKKETRGIFINKIKKLLTTIEKDTKAGKKVEGLPKLKRLLKTMKNLPAFIGETQIDQMLIVINNLLGKQETIKETTIETAVKTAAATTAAKAKATTAKAKTTTKLPPRRAVRRELPSSGFKREYRRSPQRQVIQRRTVDF